MRNVCIIQARMGSSRLPGKVLMPIGEMTMLEWCIRRAGRCRLLDDLIVATSTLPVDDAIAKVCKELCVGYWRGDPDDVLERYVDAAQWADADVVVRVTGDCPFIDPGVMTDVIRLREHHRAPYAAAFISARDSFPDGLDCEVFTTQVLRQAEKFSTDSYDREHVTPYIRRVLASKHPVLYPDRGCCCKWSVDTEADLQHVRMIAKSMSNWALPWEKILKMEDQIHEQINLQQA